MNIVGKILVVLNLVFAVTVGGFLIIDVATRSNWKTHYEARVEEIRTLTTSRDTWRETAAQLQNDVKVLKARINEGGQTRIKSKDEFDREIETMKVQLTNLMLERDQAKIDAEKALAAEKRLLEESQTLKGIIGKREGDILELSAKYQDKVKEWLAEQERANNLLIRTQSLQEEVRSARQALAQREAVATGQDPGGAPVQARDPNAPNPPAKMVKGKIAKIDPEEKDLVKVNVGEEEGLQKNHTLEVYRLTPTPEYLGMIRIVSVDYHEATGRLIRNPYTPAKALREGDTVASSLK